MRTRPSTRPLILAMAVSMALVGCASSGGGGGSSSQYPGATANRIVRAEIEDLGQVNGLQALNRLRPRWTTARGSADAPVLYVDGARRGGLQDLQSMRAADIDQMEYMSANDASTRFGTGHTGGAIMVTSRR